MHMHTISILARLPIAVNEADLLPEQCVRIVEICETLAVAEEHIEIQASALREHIGGGRPRATNGGCALRSCGGRWLIPAAEEAGNEVNDDEPYDEAFDHGPAIWPLLLLLLLLCGVAIGNLLTVLSGDSAVYRFVGGVL